MKDAKQILIRLRSLSASNMLKAAFTAFVAVCSLNLVFCDGKYTQLSFVQEGISTSGIILMAFEFFVFFCLIVCAELFLEKYRVTEWTMLAVSLILALLLIIDIDKSRQYHIFAGIIIVLAIVLNYAVSRNTFDRIPSMLDCRVKWGLVAVIAVFACIAVAAIGVFRYLTYASPNYDFGIWCQMFHNMKEHGVPETTCERDVLMSHFAVHFSPIYYLMLPFYAVFPSPVTLQILQAVILYSGVIPLCLMAKHKAVSDRATVALAAIYSLYPALAAGTFYDLHENCFLVPLLLWCFYFFEKQKYIGVAAFTVLTLLVKEDAFVYILIFALYVFFLGKKKLPAFCLGVWALAYFLIVSWLMEAYGNGIMINRYDELILDSEDGLVGVVKTALLNPAYIFTRIFEGENGSNSKILYITQLLLPLAAIPLATKRISRYILVLPVLMNLITMYVYQPNINYQYSYGITAFLFYVTVLNISELGQKTREYMLLLSAVASFLLFSMLAGGNLGYYAKRYQENKEVYEKFDQALEEVLPHDASVAATAFVIPHIADRAEVYEVKYHKQNGKYKTDTDYAVFDMRYQKENEQAVEVYRQNGYETVYYDQQTLLILKK